MEKLIELLNEYQKGLNEKEENKRNYEMYERELRSDNICMNDLGDPYEWLNIYWWYAKARLISKQFWFIERLVDNDKININEGWDDYEKTNLYCNSDFFQLQKHYSYYESLLMLLAISENPIEDLCWYLKDDATEKVDKLLDGAKRTCENIWI